MSTPEPAAAAAALTPLPASPASQWGGAAPSVPDPATIAALANALFKAFPGDPAPSTGAAGSGAPEAGFPPAPPQPDPLLASVGPSHVAAQAGSPPYAPVSPAFASSPGFPSGGQPASAPNVGLPTAASTVFAFAPAAYSQPLSPAAAPVTTPSGYGGQSEAVPSEAELAALPGALTDSTALTHPALGGAGYSAGDKALPGESLYFLDGRDSHAGATRQGVPHAGAKPSDAPALPETGSLRPGAAPDAPLPTAGATAAPAVNSPAATPATRPAVFGATPGGLITPAGFPNAPAFKIPGFEPREAASLFSSNPPLPGDLFTLPAESAAPAPPASPLPEATPSGVHTIYPVAHEVRPELGPTIGVGARPFDAASIRRDFPILRQYVHGKPLIWLDNAATTQKPQAVIDRISSFYENENSNIHRAAHTLAARATDAYEAAREKTRRFINAPSTNDIIFVRGTTEAINLIAQSYGRRNVKKGDEILITWLEHHANIVPWQMLCAETGAILKVAPVDDKGQVRLDEYEKLLSRRTRIVSFTMVANAIGTVTPAKDMIDMAHRLGSCVIADAAQAVSHMPVDVQALDCDFLVFSGHKVFGPTGIGVVYGKQQVLEAMPPWQGGGNMIADVTFEKTIYQPPPGRFEAGTGNIADAVGLGAAFDYLDTIGMANIAAYEHELLIYATEGLKSVPGLRIIGCADEKAGVFSLVLDGCRSEDVGAALDREGIAVRSGHHCAQPILRRFGLETTVRPSLALYNTFDDIDALVAALRRISVSQRFRAR
ncbi:cysteine desulfurase, SufS subfamily [Methylocella silvestris BL2]|uniref:Cysteine desulfurase n=1 Tax=Methylocella silvestris (strain DSM 15510 / CIP 108128 / LMG 27833 / NCIMB 13906 / BL2) TaxID=395965 RepID=B8EJQ6_METSB|nr:family 2A encapsulin nanocompartment cargo protein cysteine desulfurase [Methylocella silvestris]ACK49460.1 cysteine desulfurase, SufS subfamily [Methylocella silvestris BL2]